MRDILIVGAIVAAAAFTGCKKEAPKSDSQIYFKGTVNVPGHSATESFDAIAVDPATSGQLTITATNYMLSGTADESIIIFIPNFTGSGTFGFGQQQQSQPVGQAMYYAAGRGTSNAVSGSVTLTVSKESISGTYSFSCNDSVKVENGTFSVPRPQ